MNPNDTVICYSDRYTPTADEFASVDEFLGMCRAVFGEAPALTLRADGWHDDQGLVLTEAYGRRCPRVTQDPRWAGQVLELRAELAQARAEVASMNEWLDHQGAPQAQPDSWLFGRFAALLHQHEEESRLLQERATAQLRAELAKPVVGRWRRQHDPDWSARCAIEPFHRHQYAVEVGPNGWWVRAPDPGGEGSGERCASGPETGEAGRRLADEAAIAAGWRLL